MGLHEVLYSGMMQKVAASQPTVLSTPALFNHPPPIIFWVLLDMFLDQSISSTQGNANQNHSMILPHTH